MTTGNGSDVVHLQLLGCFRVTRGGVPVEVPESTQRLLALLALRGEASRSAVAAVLWPDVRERAGLARLRTALWRLQKGPVVVTVSGQLLALDQAVRTDVELLVAAGGPGGPDHGTPVRDWVGELLPGWYDDWVLYDRERLRVLQLDALERLSAAMLEAGRSGPALEAGLRAVWADPLRESARARVIAVHLAEENLVEAVQQYEAYSRLLREELGVAPSEGLRRLVRRAVAARGQSARPAAVVEPSVP